MSKTSILWYSALGHAYFHMFTAFYFVIVLSLAAEWQQPYHELLKLWTVGGLLVGVCALVAGWLGDRWSASGMLAVFFIGMGASSIAAGFAAGLTNQPLMLFIALSALGLFAAIYHPVGIPLVIRNSGARQGRALALNGVFGSLGAAMAGAVTGFLADAGGSFLAFVLPGAVVVGTGLLMLFGLRRGGLANAPAPPRAPNPHGRNAYAPFLTLLLCLTLAGVIYNTSQTGVPKVFEIRLSPGAALSVETVGYYVAAVYVAAGAFQFIGGYLADKYNLKWVYFYQLLAQAAVLIWAAYVGGWPLFVAATLAASFGAGALPAENMLLARFTPAKHYGLVFGLKFVLLFSSAPLGVLLVSAVHARTQEFVGVFLTLAAVAVIACVAVVTLPKRTAAH